MASFSGKSDNGSVKTASVIVSYDSRMDLLVVSSKATGNQVRLSLDLLRTEDRPLWELLCDSRKETDQYEEELTYDQMRSLKSLDGKKPIANGHKDPTNPKGKTPEQMLSEPVVILPASEKAKTAGSKEQEERVVNRMTRGGKGSGLDAERQKIASQMSALRKMEGKKIFVFNYYIPVELSTSHPALTDPDTSVVIQEAIPVRIPNPARMLWQYAVGLDGSNWLLTEDALNEPEVQEFCDLVESYADFRGVANRGPETWACEQSESQTAVLIARAQKMIAIRISELSTALLQNIFSADERLSAANKLFNERTASGKSVTEKERLAAEDKRNNEVRAALKKTAEDLNNAYCATERFESTEDLASLFAGVKAAFLAQQQAFQLLTEEVGNKRMKNVKGSDATLNF